MNQELLQQMSTRKGFIAALDQSGGSTPKALKLYGINEDKYSGDDEMFDMVHKMRSRIIKSRAFNSDRILGAILFENTLDRDIDGMPTSQYLLEKGILPFLKVDLGLADVQNDAQMMKPIGDLDDKLKKAVANNVFGTKMRSVIKKANAQGIKDVVAQQFDIAKKIIGYGLVPIIEPEVDINAPDKAQAEEILKQEIKAQLQTLGNDDKVIFKLTLPEVPNFYADLIGEPHTVRVVALSGGYPQAEANAKLAQNNGVIASFSRALSETLNVDQTDEEFDTTLGKAIEGIYEASVK
ncbi:MAG: fructose bisphosphate aldolase [Clostridiales bacterium]|jgi:fructose-bisphosphate aldolase class I|nr:fructose bisphosphate aldolase [Clostridiales bacterium]